ncbi:MAG: zinc ribbon domain-containing protein [Planctomycetes bacterium]|nr:zinc ribbon domain-containing protein [Planctomycetota bacterium]
MNRIVTALSLIILAGCGTSTSETVTRDKMPDVGNYPPPPAGATTRLRAGIVEFTDKTHQQGVADAAGEQLETLAVSSKRFNLIDRMAMKTLIKEQSLEGIVDPSELAKSGKIRGVDYMFIGAVTNFRLMTEKTANQGGMFDRIVPGAAPLKIDTSKTIITTDIGVDIKLVNTTTGEIVTKQFGEVKKQLSASAWGVRVLGIGGDAKNNVQVDRDSQGKLMRYAVDEALRKMLPDIDDKISHPAAQVCPKCKTEFAPGSSFCTKCGTGAEATKCAKCGTALELNAKFCGKCGTKVESPNK